MTRRKALMTRRLPQRVDGHNGSFGLLTFKGLHVQQRLKARHFGDAAGMSPVRPDSTDMRAAQA